MQHERSPFPNQEFSGKAVLQKSSSLERVALQNRRFWWGVPWKVRESKKDCLSKASILGRICAMVCLVLCPVMWSMICSITWEVICSVSWHVIWSAMWRVICSGIWEMICSIWSFDFFDFWSPSSPRASLEALGLGLRACLDPAWKQASKAPGWGG